MTEHLKELRELVDMSHGYRPGRGMPEPPDEELVARCIQVMLARQCIYPGMHAIGPYYRILSSPEYQGFFRRYFAAMALEFYHDTRSGMIALKIPGDFLRFDHRSTRLRKDETAILLTLRVAYEEAFRNKLFSDSGTVEITTDDLYDKLSAIAGLEIDEPRLMEVLNFFKRKGVVDVGERDSVEDLRPVTILPGIEIAVPPKYIEHILRAAEQATTPGEADGGSDQAAQRLTDASANPTGEPI